MLRHYFQNTMLSCHRLSGVESVRAFLQHMALPPQGSKTTTNKSSTCGKLSVTKA